MEAKKYTVCITGELNRSRAYYEREVLKRGWAFSYTLNKKVDVLVNADRRASTKTRKAERYGTDIIDADAFYQMLASAPMAETRLAN